MAYDDLLARIITDMLALDRQAVLEFLAFHVRLLLQQERRVL